MDCMVYLASITSLYFKCMLIVNMNCEFTHMLQATYYTNYKIKDYTYIPSSLNNVNIIYIISSSAKRRVGVLD